MKNSTMAFLAAATALAFATPASAQQFFGEDSDGSANTRATNVNGLAQEALFLANLEGVRTESFESFSSGSSVPLGLTFPGAGTATLSGSSGSVTHGTGAGRYPIDGLRYFMTSFGGNDPFKVTFLNPIAAFGFYGVDIGDFGSQLSLAFANGGSVTETVLVPHQLRMGAGTMADGDSFFFGYINVLKPFTSVTFNGTTSEDAFGFDRMTIGTAQQVVTVPEPGVFLLLAAGGLGMMMIARKREVIFDA